MDYFISLDIGTTSIKVVLFDCAGSVIALSKREYSLFIPSKDIVELNVETYWRCCKEGIKEAIRTSGILPKDIKSIGVCSQGETLIVLDKEGNPLRNAIVWMDNRSQKESNEIRSAFGKENIQRITGQPDVLPEWTITKILWLKRNEPALYKKIRKFLLVEDYIIYCLTGKFKGEYSLYTSSLMLDIVRKRWWGEILEYASVPPDFLVEICESGEIVSNISGPLSFELGLSPDTKIVTGAMDQTSSMLGAGNIESGIVTETTGGALAVCATVDAFPSQDIGTIAVQYHAIPDKYLLLGWCSTGGMALKWLRDTFFIAGKDTDSYEFLTSGVETVPAGSEGLVFLPYLTGAGTPHVNSEARGVFHGLSLHHNHLHFIRAVLEAIGFVLHQNIDEMGRLGVLCREVRSLGGGANSRIWNQIKADITGMPIVTMKCGESASLGTAILQAKALGIYRNFKEAIDNMVHVSTEIEPDKERHKTYESLYHKFLEVDRHCIFS